MDNKIYDVADYLAHAPYVFIAKCEIYDFDEHKIKYIRKIFPANNFTDAAAIIEKELDDELNSVTLECLDTCFTFDEETCEKFRKDTMPITTDN